MKKSRKLNKSARKQLASTIQYSLKIAKGLCKIDYYKAHEKNMKMYEFLEQEKRRLSTPKIEMITNLINSYKEWGETYESPEGKILLGIYNKNKEAAINKQTATYTNLLQILGKPETLLIAYKAIKGNQGAMTKGSILSKDVIESMTSVQRELYLKSLTFPDKISLYDFYTTSTLLSEGLYPWGSSTRVYVPKPGVLDKQRPITIPPFMDRIVQKALCLILESIFEPYFEVLN